MSSLLSLYRKQPSRLCAWLLLAISGLTPVQGWDKTEYIREDCGLELPRDRVDLGGYFEDAYYSINKSLRRKYPVGDASFEIFYSKATKWLNSVGKLPYKLFSGSNTKRSLKLFIESDKLKDRGCDHCTYLIAKGNCDASSKFGACYRKPQKTFLLGKALSQRIVQVAERCALPEHGKTGAIISSMDAYTLEVVDHITKALVETRRYGEWSSIEEMFLRIENPASVKLAPIESLLVEDSDAALAELMLNQLDRDQSLKRMLDASASISLEDVGQQFNVLVAEPCRAYREKVVVPSRAATFYLRILRLYGKLTGDQDSAMRQIYYPMLVTDAVCKDLDEKRQFHTLRQALREQWKNTQ